MPVHISQLVNLSNAHRLFSRQPSTALPSIENSRTWGNAMSRLNGGGLFKRDRHCYFDSSTSTSNSSIICKTTPSDSIRPLTATRNIRFVVALYLVLRTVFPSSPSPIASFPLTLDLAAPGVINENFLLTNGDNSVST